MPNTFTRLPPQAVDLIKRWEGFSPVWYRDGGGVRTIGYGTTALSRAINPHQIDPPITRDEGETLLLRSIRQEYAACVRENVTAPLTDLQYGALVSLCYNIGCGAFSDSTLVLLLNAGQEEEAEKEFLEWKYVNGNVIDGLLQRRKAERALFEHDEDTAFSIDPVEVKVYGAERLSTPSLDTLLDRIDTNGQQ